MPLDHRPPKIVTQRGHKKVRYRTAGNKSQITVIGCVSATGHAVPPFVIWDAKSMNKEWTNGEIAGTTYGLSNKGWVDSELFRGWMVDHFILQAVAGRPLLLMLDGHSSHYQPDLVRFAKEHDIILFCLPPHTTHKSQPLDTAVFGPLKQHWRNACHDFMQAHPGRVITKNAFSALLNKAWMITMTPSNICFRFKKCGIYPYDRNAIKCGVVSQSPKTADKSAVSTESEIVFSEEEEKLYQTRYEEGYNLFDEKYVKWLEQNHLSDIPDDLQPLTHNMPSTSASEDLVPGAEPSVNSLSSKASSETHKTAVVTPGSTSPLQPTDPDNMTSILDLLGDISPEEPLFPEADLTNPSDPQTQTDLCTPETMPGTSPSFSTTPLSSDSPSTTTIGTSSSPPSISTPKLKPPPTKSTPKGTQDSQSLPSSTPITTPSPTLSSITPSSKPTATDSASTSSAMSYPTTPASSTSSGSGFTSSGSSGCSSGSEPSGELRYVSKYLIQYVPIPKGTKPVAKRVSGARILTSSECEAILLEREAKKRRKLRRKRIGSWREKEKGERRFTKTES